MTFTYEDQTALKLRDTIVSFSADNLAAWSVGGSLGRAFRKCQFCMAVDEDMQTRVSSRFHVLEFNLVRTIHILAVS